jgi:hypothetical protein
MTGTPDSTRRSKRPQPKKRKYNSPTERNKSNRCGNSACDRYIPEAKREGNYRFVDEALILLCGECREKFDKKQEER